MFLYKAEELDWAGDRERERSRVEAPGETRVGRVEGRYLELESILEVEMNTFDCELLLSVRADEESRTGD